MPEALANGLRIAYSSAGSGPPLVLLHGGMDDSRSWRWQMNGLADEFRVLAWDAPGCGGSSEPAETWRMPDYADCLAEWLDVVGVEQPHVLGLSFEELLQGWPGLLTGAAPADVVDELVSIWADNAGTVHPAGYRAMAHSMAEADLREVLPLIKVPTLLLYGALDRRSPLPVAIELQARIPTAQLVVIPGVGHISNAEAPDEFNARVREFLASLDC